MNHAALESESRARVQNRLAGWLDPVQLHGVECASYLLTPAPSRIAAEMLQARLRKQAQALKLGTDLVAANVTAGRVHIDLAHMTGLNQRLGQLVLDRDGSYRLVLLRAFVHADRRLRRCTRALDAALRSGLPHAARLAASFDALTTWQELGAAKFGFPLDAVRARFLDLLDGAAAAFDTLAVPPGSSLFSARQHALLQLALVRVEGTQASYEKEAERQRARYGFLEHEDVPDDAAAETRALDERVQTLLERYGSARALRAELEHRCALRRAAERQYAVVLERFRTAADRRPQERLWFVAQRQLLHALARHEDRNRLAKVAWLRRFADTCALLSLPARDTGLRELLQGLRSARSQPRRSRRPVQSLPPLFDTIPWERGAELAAAAGRRFTDVSWLQQYFRQAGDLPAHVRGACVLRADEHKGNLCDLIVRVHFDSGATTIGKVFLPVLKERPALAFSPTLRERGQGIDRRMNRFRALLPSGPLRVPEAYLYDAAERVVWTEDAGAALHPLAPAAQAESAPALAAALAAVHAATPDETLRDPLRAAYLTSYPAQFLARFLDSRLRRRRWQAFLEAESQARPALIHGDLCPKNLRRDAAGAIWLLDFDRSNVASPAYDVGVFCAHLLIDAWTAGTAEDVATRFLEAYLDRSGEGEPFAFRVALHAALSLAYRAATLDFLPAASSAIGARIERQAGRLLDQPLSWRESERWM